MILRVIPWQIYIGEIVMDKEIVRSICLEKGFDEKIVDIALNCKKYRRLTNTIHNNQSRLKEKIDIDFCKKLYVDYGVPIFRIAMLFDICDVTMGRYFKEWPNIKPRGHCIGKNSFNDFFQNIDTKEKAYFLGLLAADGSVVKHKTAISIRLELSESDGYIIEKFNEVGNFKEAIRFHIDSHAPRKYIGINSVHMANDLKQYGIVPNKSHKDSIFIPELNEKLIPHFIRGYFDGDGIANSKGYIGFCGSKTIIEQIHNHLIKTLSITQTKITYNKSNHIYYIQWGKKQDTLKIANYMYQDCKDLFLTRKYLKIHERLWASGMATYRAEIQ